MINGRITRWTLIGDRFDSATQRDVLASGMYGHLWAQDVHVSTMEGEELLVPTLELMSNPTIRLSDIRARRFHIVDRAQIVMVNPVVRPGLVSISTRRNWTIERFVLAGA